MTRLLLLLFLVQFCRATVDNETTVTTEEPPPPQPKRAPACSIPSSLVTEIKRYSPIVKLIMFYAQVGEYRGRVFKDIGDFVDTFGNRLTGTCNLEAAIDGAIDRIEKAGLDVTTDPVRVPQWVRGHEEASIVVPRNVKLNILGLGTSAGTPPEGITAEVLLVYDVSQLEYRQSELPGKIVLINQIFTSYSSTVVARNDGPSLASKWGAAAVLIRSVTPYSIWSPHTGVTDFEPGVKPIPAAAIALEDADLISRLIESGKKVRINLIMGAKTLPDRYSRNIIGDLPGRILPEEYVTISGHIDSWDVGQGAMDDAGGAFLGWHSVALIRELNQKYGFPLPRRTLRSILWTAEELGLIGAKSYLKDHREELRNWSMAIESDMGIYATYGLSLASTPTAYCIVREVLRLVIPGYMVLDAVPTAGSDISVFTDVDVPTAEPYFSSGSYQNYFYYHHSNGDVLNILNSRNVDQNLAVLAASAYVLADLSVKLPRPADNINVLLKQVKGEPAFKLYNETTIT